MLVYVLSWIPGAPGNPWLRDRTRPLLCRI